MVGCGQMATGRRGKYFLIWLRGLSTGMKATQLISRHFLSDGSCGSCFRDILKKGYLEKGLPRGVKIPRVPTGTVGQDDADVETSSERLKKAFRRLENGDVADFDSPGFGKMSHTDRIRLNLRHAELHLGYLSLLQNSD